MGLVVVIVGIGLRILASRRGHNYDFDSYLLVAEGREQGVSPWQTGRYNYGPIWAQVLYIFSWTETTFGLSFRMQIIALLTIADLIIGYFIFRVRGLGIASCFFMNPISIVITGYHNQFDNLAISIACVAMLISRDVQIGPLRWRDVITTMILALSLSTKHVLLVFVVWLAMRQVGAIRKLAYLLIPCLLFLVSFTPFLTSSWAAINKTVIGYDSADNGPIWDLLGIQDGLGPVPITVLFAILLTFIGYPMRRQSQHESLFVYLIFIVVLTPSLVSQYFAIAAIGAIGLFSLWFLPYFIIGAYHMLTGYHELHFASESLLIGLAIPDEPILTTLLAVTFMFIPFALSVGYLAYVLRRRAQLPSVSNELNPMFTSSNVGQLAVSGLDDDDGKR